MKNKISTTFIFLAVFTLLLFGCGKKHVLDGPGMINDRPWRGFTLTYADGDSAYDFHFSVQQGDFALLLTGQCRDVAGELLVLEEGVELSVDDLQYLRDLQLQDLPEPDSTHGTPEIVLVMVWMDGNEQERELSKETAMEIYERFLPYFTNNIN